MKVQLNIYVPKDRAEILELLDRVAARSNRPKNEIVLEALERYLMDLTPRMLEKFSLGEVKDIDREKLYERGLKG
jgi:predicted DNA-binding protein